MRSNTNTGGDFNGIAPLYDTLAFVVFGRQLRQAQTVFLDTIPAGASVLIVGGGTGWLLEQVLTRCQPSRCVYLEASAKMLARATDRMVQNSVTGCVDFRLGTESSLAPDEQFDAILTSFVLDVFSERTLQTQFIPRLRRALKPAGVWLITDFVHTDVWWQKVLLWGMVRFFRLTTGMQARSLANWQLMLVNCGLQRLSYQPRVGGMVSAEVWSRPAGIS